MPEQSPNRINEWIDIHVSSNGTKVLWLYNVRNITFHCNMASEIRCKRGWKSLVAHLPHFQFHLIDDFLPFWYSSYEYVLSQWYGSFLEIIFSVCAGFTNYCLWIKLEWWKMESTRRSWMWFNNWNSKRLESQRSFCSHCDLLDSRWV